MSNPWNRGRGRGSQGNGRGRGQQGPGQGHQSQPPPSAPLPTSGPPPPAQGAWGRRPTTNVSSAEAGVANINLGSSDFPSMTPSSSAWRTSSSSGSRSGAEIPPQQNADGDRNRGPPPEVQNGDRNRGPPPPNGDGNRGRGQPPSNGRRAPEGASGGRRPAAPEGRRGVRRERFGAESMDVVLSKPTVYPETNTKKGTIGHHVDLVSNFFILQKRTNWCIFNYRVDFKPEEENTRDRKFLFKNHRETIGPHIFDGCTLYTANRLSPEPLLLYSTKGDGPDATKYEIIVKFVKELDPGDVSSLQFFNIIVRKCLSALKLEEIGRHFYDKENEIDMSQYKLKLWPGYITSMRNYERDVMLCVEVTHKVLRQDNVLDTIRTLKQNGMREDAIKDELIGTIVMTHYNKKTYRIDDIDWSKTPKSTFPMGREERDVSYLEYYKDRYKQIIREVDQPLIMSRPKKRDVHRGQTGPICLIPEFCQMTGLTDQMRSNFTMMRELAQHLNKGPNARFHAINNFRRRLEACTDVQNDLQTWDLKLSKDLVSYRGRVIPGEDICFDGSFEPAKGDADWSQAFRSRKLLQANNQLEHWVLIVPQRESNGIEEFIGMMKKVSKPLGFRVFDPIIVRIPNIQIRTYTEAIDKACANYGKKGLQLLFAILPNNKVDTYAAVKRKCVADYGMLSQCYLAKNVTHKNRMSIATNVAIQMSAKLGGEPWKVANPMKTCMIIGFDVFHCGKRKGRSVGAMVCTTTESLAKYFSAVSFHDNREELSANVCTDVTKCVRAYESVNNRLPQRIIMYRDGVGEGQLTYVYNTELVQIKNALNSIYTAAELPPPKFSFIVCTKKINTRIFASVGRIENPRPGTIVDDVITLPERWDFFLVAQNSRIGTVSPTNYNVLYDEQGLSPDKIQRLTYKLCHMYFNWSGTVAVPACCQYAHKLAYLTGVALGGKGPHESLSHLLYYL